LHILIVSLHLPLGYKNFTPLFAMKTPDELNQLSGIVLDAAIAVHREMGPGLLETVYHHCLLEELSHRSIEFKIQL
jgi:hypothetical protein